MLPLEGLDRLHAHNIQSHFSLESWEGIYPELPESQLAGYNLELHTDNVLGPHCFVS